MNFSAFFFFGGMRVEMAEVAEVVVVVAQELRQTQTASTEARRATGRMFTGILLAIFVAKSSRGLT